MKNFRKFLIAGIATSAVVIGSSTFASAADLFEPAPVAENPFNGFFIGVHGGYGWADTKGTAGFSFGGGGDGGPLSYDQDGGLLGVQAGANFVMESGWLFGFAVSGSWANISGRDSIFGDGYDARFERTINAIGLMEGRLGYAMDQYMFYVSGGGAVAQYDVDVFVRSAAGDGFFNWDDTTSGWTIGGGVEMMVTDNVSAGISYNYIDLDRQTGGDSVVLSGGPPVAAGSRMRMEMSVVKFNVNYNF